MRACLRAMYWTVVISVSQRIAVSIATFFVFLKVFRRRSSCAQAVSRRFPFFPDYFFVSFDIHTRQHIQFIRCTRWNFSSLSTSSPLQFPTFPKPLSIGRTLRRLPFFAKRFLRRSVREDFATRLRRDWYCIIDNRSTTDLKCRRWLCGNRIVSINESAVDSLWNEMRGTWC